MKRLVGLALGVAATLWLAGCAAEANPLMHEAASNGKVAGFWLGLWHGMIAVIAFIVSLFNHSVTVYEVHNNGAWYNFGFLLGIGAFTGGGGHLSGRAKS